MHHQFTFCQYLACISDSIRRYAWGCPVFCDIRLFLFHSDFRFADFGRWYAKRIKRIYITVILIALLNCFVNGFPATAAEWIAVFIYPTQWHFIASIMVLYIVYYIWIHFLKQWKIQVWISAVIFSALVLCIYIFAFDKSWYHIDVVEEHFIRFLFFISMLLGAHFREMEEKKGGFLNGNVYYLSALCAAGVVLYFAVRIAVPRFELFTVQILTWPAILTALYGIFRWAAALENRLAGLPGKLGGAMDFLAGITLQIYLVQGPILGRVDHFRFPLNLLAAVVLILAAAAVVYYMDYAIRRALERISFKK